MGRAPTVVLVQMAGSPGSGKSALARALGSRLEAVVLDKDVVKSALLDASASWEVAGGAAHEVMFALADTMLDQGLSVVLDTTSHFAAIPQRGSSIARDRGSAYRFIECICEDLDEVERRLRGRSPLRSQWTGIDAQSSDGSGSAEKVGHNRWRTYGPEHEWLVLDTSQPLEVCLSAALQYVAAT